MTAPNFADKTMSRYWAYKNWTNKRARFHRADCPYCNDGRGNQGVIGKRWNDQWHGPFGTREEAERCVKSIGRENGWENVGPCGNCLG